MISYFFRAECYSHILQIFITHLSVEGQLSLVQLFVTVDKAVHIGGATNYLHGKVWSSLGLHPGVEWWSHMVTL